MLSEIESMFLMQFIYGHAQANGKAVDFKRGHMGVTKSGLCPACGKKAVPEETCIPPYKWDEWVKHLHSVVAIVCGGDSPHESALELIERETTRLVAPNNWRDVCADMIREGKDEEAWELLFNESRGAAKKPGLLAVLVALENLARVVGEATLRHSVGTELSIVHALADIQKAREAWKAAIDL